MFALQRYTPDGELDTTFGTPAPTLANPDQRSGMASTSFDGDSQIFALAVDTDARIIAAGEVNAFPEAGYVPTFAIARYSIDGTIDTGFGADGFAIGDVYPDGFGIGLVASLAIQTDGTTHQQSVAVAGAIDSPSQFVLNRYDLDVAGSSSAFDAHLSGPSTANEGDLVTVHASLSGGEGSS